MKTSTFRMLMTVWPLMFGISLIMISYGLQSTLLGLRAEHEAFPAFVTGLIMSMYFCGFLVGCRYVPQLIASVGHIRVFAALASIASTTILLHGVFVNPVVWIVIRLFTGFCFSGIFIIAESWLNKIATRKMRGKVFAAYISVVNGGVFLGQFLINLAPVEKIDLFIIVSVLISLALAPITLTNTRTPNYKKPDVVPFSTVFKTSPLAMAGVFVSGMSSATVIGLGPVYGNMIGLSTPEISYFMAIYILGNTLLPLYFGSLSDKVDRRKVILGIAILGLAISVLITAVPSLYLMSFFIGGATTALYSVSITHMQDFTKKSQIVSTSRSLILFNAVGAMFGPVISGFTLDYWGTKPFFGLVGCYMFFVICVASYRTITGKTIAQERKKKFTALPTFSAPTVFRLRMEKPPADVPHNSGDNPAP